MPEETMNRSELKAKFFRGFADWVRISILECLLDGEKSVAEIADAVGAKQSRISNHLACLRWCNFVQTRQEGRQIFYSIKDSQIEKILKIADNILASNAEQVYSCTRM
jgi:DNA-binding transcriptional ArsR family regulator